MKFTKQEQSLIKLAAAHMAPQMTKKATLQDKLAEYGIGMSKKAADPSGYMKAVNPLTGFPGASAGAQVGARLASRVAPYVAGGATGDIAKAAPTKTAPAPTTAVQGSGAAGSIAKDNIANLIRQMSQRANARSAAAAQTGAALGSALAGRQQPQAQAPAAGSNLIRTAAPGMPMIGQPVPTDAAIESPYDGKTSTQYPYMSSRAGQQLWTEVGGREKAVENARIFDNALNKQLQTKPWGQGIVDEARQAQASELARRVAAPGTNQYEDALNMLIQAGRNNQKSFENKGETIPRHPNFEIPEGYEGPNRLNGGQQKSLREFFPAMGATGNARRFSNLS